MDWKDFKPGELIELKNNPYVKSATVKMIRFTTTFKEEFWKQYQNGKPPVSIITEMGFNPDVLGASRINGITQHIKEQANSGSGFRDERQPSTLSENTDNLVPSKALIHLQHEIAYMKQELEFIKKIILADKEASRRCSSKKNRVSNSESFEK